MFCQCLFKVLVINKGIVPVVLVDLELVHAEIVVVVVVTGDIVVVVRVVVIAVLVVVAVVTVVIADDDAVGKTDQMLSKR